MQIIPVAHQNLSFGFLRTPEAQSPLFSFQNPVLAHLRENFRSLIAGAGRCLHTPMNFYAYLPSQALQMNYGLLKMLGFQSPAWKWLPAMAQQALQPNAFAQSAFQNMISQGSLANTQSTSRADLIQNQLQNRILQPEPAVSAKLQEVNQKRAQKGQAPIAFASVTREIENILNQPGLSEKEKKSQIGALRKRLGLGKKDMRTLFTQRLKNIYQNAALEIRTQLQNTTDPVERQKLETQLQSYEGKAKFYDGMFKSFWSKLGGAFKKIGGFFKKIGTGFLKIVPFLSPVFKLMPTLVKSGIQKLIQAF